MFNLNELKVIKGYERDDQRYSFVGIKRNTETNQLEFWLPLNFYEFPQQDKEQVKKFFFKMYKTLKVFNKNNKNQSSFRSENRDGTIQAGGGLKLIYDNKEEVIFYSKISMLEAVITSFDEMAIAAIIRKNTVYGDTKLERIDRYFDKAIYTEDDSFYIENIPSYRNTIGLRSTIIVELFCFIYLEIKKELDEDAHISNDIFHLASRFKEQHLSSTSTIFGEHFENTIAILKKVLDDIHRNTFYKDGDFWLLFDAVERFLYGEFAPNAEAGEFWGINNFWAVWEDMCHEYFFKNYLNSIAYADSNKYGNEKIHQNTKVFINHNILNENIFYFEYMGQKRFLKPDIVIFNKKHEKITDTEKENHLRQLVNIDKHEETTQYIPNKKKLNSNIVKIVVKPTRHKDSVYWTSLVIDTLNKYALRKQNRYNATFEQYKEPDYHKAIKEILERHDHELIGEQRQILIADYKYMSNKDISTNCEKTIYDVKKQKIYEFTLRLWDKEDSTYSSQFIIPYYSSNNIEIFFDLAPSQILKDNKIKLVGGNFQIIQSNYIQQDS